MSSNPLGDLEDVTFVRPAITEFKDKESGEKLEATWMPVKMAAQVVDPETPKGKHLIASGKVDKDGKVYLPMRNTIIQPSKAEERRYTSERICKFCTKFDYAKGQAAIQASDLKEKLEKARIESSYLGVELKYFGLCAEGSSKGGEKAVSPLGTCPNFVDRKNGYNFYMRSKEMVRKLATAGRQTVGKVLDDLTAPSRPPKEESTAPLKITDRRGHHGKASDGE